jgi:hypothetical protein
LSSCIIAQCCFNHLGVVSSGSLVQSRLNSTELRDFICCSLSRSSCTMGWEFWKSNCVLNVRCMQAVTPPKNVGPSKETKKTESDETVSKYRIQFLEYMQSFVNSLQSCLQLLIAGDVALCHWPENDGWTKGNLS